jgi:hypothetical protein
MIRIDFNRLRFLVIDDNVHMRRIVRTLLPASARVTSMRPRTARPDSTPSSITSHRDDRLGDADLRRP